jgi:hypothetical protein
MNSPPTVGPENAATAFRAFLQSTTATMHAGRQELALEAAERSSLDCSNDAPACGQTDERGSDAPTENDDFADTCGANNALSEPFADQYERECDKHAESISDNKHPVEETSEQDGSENSQHGFAHRYYPVSDMRSTSGSSPRSPLPNPRGSEFIARVHAMTAKRIDQQTASVNNSVCLQLVDGLQ